MALKKNIRFRNRCGFKLSAPTGKKCKRREKELQEDLIDVYAEDIINPGGEEDCTT